MPEQTVTEAAAVFPDERSLLGAIDELLSSGFDRAQLSVVGTDEAVRGRLGERYRDIRDAAADPSLRREVPVQPEETREGMAVTAGIAAYAGALAVAGVVAASGGALIPAAIGAAAGGTAGGALGGLLGRKLGQLQRTRVET